MAGRGGRRARQAGVTAVLPFVNNAFDDQGQPVNPMTGASLKIRLDDLGWWSNVLERARAPGELVPGQLRARAAMAALAPSPSRH